MKRIVILVAVACSCCRGPATDHHVRETVELAQLAIRRGELIKAQNLVADALSTVPTTANSEWDWQLRLLLAEIALDRVDTAQATPLLTAQIPSGPSFDSLRARQKYLQSRAKVMEGKLTDALETLSEAQTLAPGAGEVQRDSEILDGQLRLRLGQWDEGQRRLEAVVRQSGESRDFYRQAVALNTLGMGYLVRSRYDEAVAWFERVLALTDLNDLTIYAVSLYNAGICYSRLGEFERAKAVQQRAVQIHEKKGPSRQLVESLGSLGTTFGLNGQAREAIPFLERALETATKTNLQGDAALWAGNLATAFASLGDWNHATKFNDEAKRLGTGDRAVKPVYFTLNAAEIAAGNGQLAQAQTLFEDALASADGTPAVIWSAHSGLARVAMASQQPARAARHFEAALGTIEKTRSSLLRTEFKLSFLTQLIEFYQSYVEALLSENKVEKALEVTESSRARVLAERHGVQTTGRTDVATLKQVARQSKSILLSYWLAPTRSSMWIVSAEGVRHVSLPASKDIEAQVRQHQAMIQNTLANPLAPGDTPGDKLYEWLIAPAAGAIKPGTPVIIVPDGALHRVNFETLVVKGERKHYWIEDAEIQIAPSLMTLVSKETRPAAPRSLLLIGDATAREPEFPALRYAPSEMANISRHLPAGSVTTRRSVDATPGAYRDASPDRFSMIHFTAHAVANTESPLDSAIMLSGPDNAFKLYARDVAERPLNADLVTVSACRSAGERTYSGEGLVGFAWAFLRAGARRVIAGLWDVDDKSTADLMDAVYARIAAGMPPPRALREAKLALLSKGGTTARPYYWAPFEVFTVTTAN